MRSLVVLLLVAATARADAPIGNRAPPAPAYGPSAPFAVALAQHAFAWGNAPAFWLCPLEHALVACGTRRLVVVDGDKVGPDASREAGLPRASDGVLDGFVAGAFGTWPDEAWLVIQREVRQCGLCNFVAYRWDGKAWVKRGELRDQVRLGPAAVWRRSLIALVADDTTQGAPRRVIAIGPAAAPVTCLRPDAITALPGGGLAIGGTSCATPGASVQRWDKDGASVATDEVFADPAAIQLRATRAGELVAFGHLYADERGAIARLDGASWKSVDAPKSYEITAYDRAPDGTEWAIVSVRDAASTVWARAKSKAWARVRFAVPAALGTKRVEPWAVQVGDGVVWLEVTTNGGECAGIQGCQNRSLALRTGGPTQHLVRADVER